MAALLHERIWYDQRKYELAESVLVKSSTSCQNVKSPIKSPISASFAKISADIESSLQTTSQHSESDQVGSRGDAAKIKSLEEDNQDLRKIIRDLTERIARLEAHCFSSAGQSQQSEPVARKPAESKTDDDDNDDDDFDLFGSDEEEDERAEQLKAERVAAYQAKKAKKPTVVAKSNLILDVKPWDDETDMKDIEKCVRSIKVDGLLWGKSKLVPLAYGIHKLQITCVIEDDKVGTDLLEERITAFEDLVQSMDVVAFNKI